MVTLTLRSRGEPKFITSGGELTGVHVWLNQPPPRPGAYHIGASARSLDECLIKTLGETIERYSHYAVAKLLKHRFASVHDMKERGEPIPDLQDLAFWTDEQLDNKHFPFRNLHEQDSVAWLDSVSVTGQHLWLPSQMILTGYQIRTDLREPWLFPAVTTGTAAHTDPLLAIKNALLEIVQLDAAMGHWFSNTRTPQIILDARTAGLADTISRAFAGSDFAPSFALLCNPDLFGISVACLLENKKSGTPGVVVGLGSAWKLEEAMYKALKEATGVLQLVKFVSLTPRDTNIANIADLDTNVAWYAKPVNSSIVLDKFLSGLKINAGDVAADFHGSDAEAMEKTVHSFAATGKRLFIYDFTTADIRDLAFHAIRAFSPDTLSLCLPSFCPRGHRRFAAYDGFRNVHPHPFA